MVSHGFTLSKNEIMNLSTACFSVVCGNWFFHMTGLYSFALSAIYGITLYSLSEYTDLALLDAIVDTKSATATLYPWQIRYERVFFL